jgi:signal transduction histidine kinase
MALGADDYITKPFTSSELMAAVEARLAKHAQITDEAERKLTQLRSSISLALPHELRTPLTGILGFAHVFVEEAGSLSAEEIGQFGKLIEKEAKRLQRLIENFLIYAQIELVARDAGKTASLRNAKISNSSDVIGPAVRNKARSYDRLSDLTIELVESSAAISMEHLMKILEELLDNALKFSNRCTPVAIRTSVTNGDLVLTITDHGRGMTPNQLADIGAYLQFEREFHEHQGMGLGLVIAKRLTEIHGGGMEFRQSPGGGLTVSVHLPTRPIEQ